MLARCTLFRHPPSHFYIYMLPNQRKNLLVFPNQWMNVMLLQRNLSHGPQWSLIPVWTKMIPWCSFLLKGSSTCTITCVRLRRQKNNVIFHIYKANKDDESEVFNQMYSQSLDFVNVPKVSTTRLDYLQAFPISFAFSRFHICLYDWNLIETVLS